MKIVLKLMGGLGNQLFQLSYALRLLELYNADIIVVDLSYYQEHHLRKPEITKLNIAHLPLCFVDKYESIKYNVSTKLFHSMQALSKRILGKKLDYLFPYLANRGFFFTDCKVSNEPISINRDELILWGYFQDINALCPKKVIKSILDLPNLDLIKYCNKVKEVSNSVAISIRCGKDYVNNGYPIITRDFYLKAIDLIESNKGKSTYFVFSDDLEKALTLLPREFKYVVVKNESPIIDLLKMSYCNDFIISNSSFSWWGAYLSDISPIKQVICPKRWDSYTLTQNSHLLYEGCSIIE